MLCHNYTWQHNREKTNISSQPSPVYYDSRSCAPRMAPKNTHILHKDTCVLTTSPPRNRPQSCLGPAWQTCKVYNRRLYGPHQYFAYAHARLTAASMWAPHKMCGRLESLWLRSPPHILVGQLSVGCQRIWNTSSRVSVIFSRSQFDS